MPYTNAQLQAASSDFRATYGHMPDDMAIHLALDMLAEFEHHNCPVYDERTGEVIDGEPFVVETVITFWIPASREERHYHCWRGQVRQTRIVEHYYVDEDSAYEDGCRKCDNCGEWRYKDNLGDDLYVGDNWYCCYDCSREAGWETCERCGEWVDEYDRVIVDTNDYHVYCDEICAERDGWTRCDHCEEWVDGDYTWSVGDESWCESCADYHSAECDECGERYPDDDIEYDEERDQNLCPCCRGEIRHHRSTGGHSPRAEYCLHSYGWTPVLTFRTLDEGYNRWQKKQPLFLGVELETDGGNNRFEYVCKLASIPLFNDHFWMTEDSSLSAGVEITGHPMTLDYHETLLQTVYEEISKAAIEFGFRSHDGGRCGLHVHVNRDFFGQDKRLQDAGGYKLMRLLQRFEKLFTMFSRRENNRWCQYRTYNDGYKLNDEVKVCRVEKNEEGLLQVSGRMVADEKAHAQCINFEHAATFEFRIFRGTLKWTTYFACLAMVDGLCHTVKQHGSIWVESVCWIDLMAEVVRNCTNPFAAECLCNYLDDKGLR